ncbi:MAG: QueT transporter family protein [Firmicutes bacterium]|nr:QueT transporter family protein [Bacillota bacterium]
MANINKKMKQNQEKVETEAQKTQLQIEQEAKARNRKIKAMMYLRALLYAVIYVCITLALKPVSYELKQLRIADAMLGLVYFDPAAGPGIILGRFVADMLGPGGFYNAFPGTAAIGFGWYFIKFLGERGNKPIVGLLTYALFNAIMVGVMFSYSGRYADTSLIMCFIYILVSSLICAVGGGMAVYKIASRSWEDIVSAPAQSQEP